MTMVDNLHWTYTWNVQPSVYGLQQVSVTAFDASGSLCAPATGKTAYEIKNLDPVNYVYVMQLTGISYPAASRSITMDIFMRPARTIR